MRAKKFISAVTAFAMSCTVLSAFGGTANAALSPNGGFSAEQIAASDIKPTLTLSHEVISLDEAQNNRIRKVTLSVSGADAKYSATGIHIYYDKRLTVPTKKNSALDVTKGYALYDISITKASEDTNASNFGMKGIFLCSADVEQPKRNIEKHNRTSRNILNKYECNHISFTLKVDFTLFIQTGTRELIPCACFTV